MNVLRNQDVKFMFHNQTGRFRPGETVNGTFQFKFIFPKHVRCIYLDFNGVCETNFTKTGMRVKKAQGGDGKLSVTGKDVIVQTRIYYIGEPNLQSDEEIPAGVYSHDFEFVLPDNIPPSFEATNKYGVVNYSIKMVIIKRDRTSEETIQPFYVDTPPIDLRGQAHLFESMTVPIMKHIGALCCTAGSININISVPRQAYKPKEKIIVSIDCENGSKFKIETIQVTLNKILTLHFYEPIMDKIVRPEPIVAHQTPAIPKNSTKGFQLELVIPSNLKPFDLRNCKLIELCYALNVKAVVAAGIFNPQAEIPIAIGDIVNSEDLPQSLDFNICPPSYSSATNQYLKPTAPGYEKY